jgi:nitroreductase
MNASARSERRVRSEHPVRPEAARRLVELACLAPSIHNTQPWAWSGDGDRLVLRADARRRLPVEDPLGRNLAISCGAALDHLARAARALGWAPTTSLLPRDDEPDVLAEVRLVPGVPSPTAATDIATLRRRCTDRRRFTSWPVPDHLIEYLAEAARGGGVRAVPIRDAVERIRVEILANRAFDAQQADAATAREQHRWVGREGRDGMPLAVIPAGPADVDPLVRFGAGFLEDTGRALQSGDRVIVLGGDRDDTAAWLRAGIGLSALWLRATELGLSLVPLSQPIEVTAVREELRARVLHDRLVPHILVRVGWQAIGRSDLPRTPRRRVDDVLTLSVGT